MAFDDEDYKLMRDISTNLLTLEGIHDRLVDIDKSLDNFAEKLKT